MKVFVILSAILALANAGGKTLSAAESEEHLRNFKLFCNPNAGKSGQDQDGNTMYYCKTADEPITLKVDHEQELDAGETPKQVIYVQPPQYVYRHAVGISGSPGTPQETEIYVLPQKATHELNVKDQRTRTQANKPQLYFLTGSGSEPDYSGVGAVPGASRSANYAPARQQISSVSGSLGQQAQSYNAGTGSSGQQGPGAFAGSGQSYLPPRPSAYVQPYARVQRNVYSNNINNNPQQQSY